MRTSFTFIKWHKKRTTRLCETQAEWFEAMVFSFLFCAYENRGSSEKAAPGRILLMPLRFHYI